ncbi:MULTISPECIES: hypothetical protein [Telluria group]|uniref:Uncharacterized protein n=1 Tax=Pseudoduganella violacea TaxID=1715466 RepID=A0A7W5B675_9BURK|nr:MULTISPECIES: hypothetical protein [Telluria group]AKU23174.1 hypothetical protein ACZ75_18640 [Massilia sp. NR 4-1]MBB3117191.1 hypothetical protein [Pseudoduganella violacea]NVD96806.1 hypothetical protein [Massilia sp. BJB1822]UMR31915.1 hypothetical protein MJ904_06930 [Massilia sp. MB5]UTY57100.1 hypothetical protein HPQ68_07770 [Massilia sp. erpn]
MLFLKSTTVTKAPGIYEVDIAAKPPGKTYGVYMATDPDNPPTAVLEALAALGFQNTHSSGYVHKDRGKVLDLHFQKDGTDLFKGWKAEECEANMAAITKLFGDIGIAIAPRVMTLAEAYA